MSKTTLEILALCARAQRQAQRAIDLRAQSTSSAPSREAGSVTPGK